jgi:exosome complex RNA-binding protein Rrp4
VSVKVNMAQNGRIWIGCIKGRAKNLESVFAHL